MKKKKKKENRGNGSLGRNRYVRKAEKGELSFIPVNYFDISHHCKCSKQTKMGLIWHGSYKGIHSPHTHHLHNTACRLRHFADENSGGQVQEKLKAPKEKWRRKGKNFSCFIKIGWIKAKWGKLKKERVLPVCHWVKINNFFLYLVVFRAQKQGQSC